MVEINIPKDLLPLDGRFGCGPSKVRPEQLAAFNTEGAKLIGTSHRQAPVKNLVKRVQDGLMDLFHNPNGYEIVLGNGGSTAFWDVASFSLAEGKSQLLVHGEFGAKFATSLSAPWLEKPTVVQAEAGSRSELRAEAGISAYAYPQNETSTGVVTPVKRVPAADAGASCPGRHCIAAGIAIRARLRKQASALRRGRRLQQRRGNRPSSRGRSDTPPSFQGRPRRVSTPK